MNKLKLSMIICLAATALTGSFLCCYAKNVSNSSKVILENKATAVNSKTAPLTSSEYTQFNDFFTPAFQLLWNDFSDKFVKGKITFTDETPTIVNRLNERRIEEGMFSPKDLYKTVGKQTFATKKRIEKDLKRKFNEESKLLDSIQWFKKTDDRFVLYSMFKKDVFFINSFKDLTSASFNNSKEKYKYFGVTINSEFYQKYVTPIYYNNNNDYAVNLATKSGDEIILLTDNSNKPVFEIWDNFYKTKLSENNDLVFDEDSKLLIPQIDFKNRINYKELTNKKIKGSNYIIETALEDIEFSLDKDGAKIKNEAIMSIKRMALRPDSLQKIYNFNKPFVLFIRSKDAKVPYFALKVKDTKYLIKDDNN